MKTATNQPTEMTAGRSAGRTHVLHDVSVECRASDDCRRQGQKPQTQRRRKERSQSVITVHLFCKLIAAMNTNAAEGYRQ